MLQRNSQAAGFIEPCLPSPAKAPPTGPDWLHEIKHDGFRLMARRDVKGVRVYTRNGNDFTQRFPLIVERSRCCRLAAACSTARRLSLTRPVSRCSS
jgi:ATP-dependent DNA ligase